MYLQYEASILNRLPFLLWSRISELIKDERIKISKRLEEKTYHLFQKKKETMHKRC